LPGAMLNLEVVWNRRFPCGSHRHSAGVLKFCMSSI
jgi:hypothetical protein